MHCRIVSYSNRFFGGFRRTLKEARRITTTLRALRTTVLAVPKAPVGAEPFGEFGNRLQHFTDSKKFMSCLAA